MQEKKTLFMPGWCVVIRPGQIIISSKASEAEQEMVGEILGPPRLFRGLPADHLTIPLTPLASGPDAGGYGLHLTWHVPGTKWSEHRVIANLHPRWLDERKELLHQRFLEIFHRRLRPTSPEALESRGVRVLRISRSAEQAMESAMEAPNWKRRITEEDLEVWGQDSVELHPPRVLHEPAIIGEKRPQYAVEPMGDDSRAISLYCFRDKSKVPHWYEIVDMEALAQDWHALAVEMFGDAFHRVALIVARELKAPLREDTMRKYAYLLVDAREGRREGASRPTGTGTL